MARSKQDDSMTADQFEFRLNGLKARLDILAMLAANAGVDCLMEHSLSTELVHLADEAQALHHLSRAAHPARRRREP